MRARSVIVAAFVVLVGFSAVAAYEIATPRANGWHEIAWSFPRWSVSAHLDQFLGNAAYQGTLLTVYMSLHIGGHGGWQ